MTRKRYKPEEIVAKLRQVDVMTLHGQSMAHGPRQIGVSEVTCAMSYSTVRSSKRRGKLRSSPRAGGATATRSDRTPVSATNHQHRGLRTGVHGVAGHAGVNSNSQLTFRVDF
jgi:hypothetical protein